VLGVTPSLSPSSTRGRGILPTRASARRILDVGPAEDVAKECARCGGIVGINQGVNAGDHQTELLKSPKFYYLSLPPIKNPLMEV
jgi:hypothetical protein